MASQVYPSQPTYFVQFGSEPYYNPYTTPITSQSTMSSSSSTYLPGIYSSSGAKAPSGIPTTSLAAVPAPTKQIHRNRASYSCHCCRRRKVKCDQVHPTCGNCKKHGDECTYNDNSNVKSKKKDGVKKNLSASSSANMASSRSKQSKYDDGRLLASPIYSDFPSVTPVAGSSYGSPSSSTYLQPTPVSSGYPSPQAYSPSYYSDYASPPASSNTYYDYAYSTSAYSSSIPASVDPIMSSYPPTSSYDDSAYAAYTTSEPSYGYYQTSG